MASTKTARVISELEEIVNTMSHGFGLLLSLGGFILLFTFHASSMSWGKGFVLAIFGCSLVALYLASTLYHREKNQQRKLFLKYCDHAAIFVLIAGTYTPFCLNGTPEGLRLAITVWSMAVIGIVAKFYLVGRFRFVSTLMYLLMGWAAIFHMDFLRALPSGELNWLIAGGSLYSAGTIFYLWRSLPYSHGIWHLFVLGGSICHYLGVLFYVAP